MRILFMGTPDFARESLRALVEDGREVVCVITQPDKPKGRGYEKAMSDVKKYALEKGLVVEQPETLKDNAVLPLLEKYHPDIILVVAYGKILPEYVLNYPKYGCINIHGSILPKFRGAAPIQRAVMAGEAESGVTSMYMAKGLDSGDILFTDKVKIERGMTAGELYEILASRGGKILLKTIDAVENGTLEPQKQNESLATYAPQLTKAEGEIDWNDSAENIYNKVRGLNPWPCAFSFVNGKRFVIDFVYPCDGNGKPGEIISVSAKGFVVACGNGAVRIENVKFEGKKKMTVSQYLCGHTVETGTVLGI